MKKFNCLTELQDAKSVCIIGHVNADPDALSSMVVFRDFLKDIFKIHKVDLFSESEILSGSMLEILGTCKIHTNTKDIKTRKYQACIVMDCPNLDRLGGFDFLFANASTTFVIDHHATNQNFAKYNIVEQISSTSEIVYKIAKHFKYKLSNEQKGKLYAGIICDTNNFTVGEFNNNTFKICSDLIKFNDKKSIYNAFLANNTLKSMQLLALAIQNIVSFDHNQIIITHITHEEASKYKATHDDLYKIINQIATINTAKMICFLEPKDNKYYVSMRAKVGYDVSTIAKANGGGGHVGAAAFMSSLSLKETEQLILTEFRRQTSTVKMVNKKLF